MAAFWAVMGARVQFHSASTLVTLDFYKKAPAGGVGTPTGKLGGLQRAHGLLGWLWVPFIHC